MAWALSSPLQFHLQIHSDSTYAVGVAHLGPHQRHAHVLAQCLAGVVAAARLARPTSCSHVHGHDWQPWNELADGLAKHAVAIRMLLNAPDLAHFLALKVDAPSGPWSQAGWLFLPFLDPAAREAYPDVCMDRFVVRRPRSSQFPEMVLRPTVQRTLLAARHL